MGRQQPSAAAAAGDATHLELPDADSPARSRRAGHSHVTPAESRRGAYDDGTRRTKSSNGGVIDSVVGITDVPRGSPTPRAFSRAVCTAASNRRKQSSSSWSGVSTPTSNASARSPTKNWTADSGSAADGIVELGSAIARCAVEHRAALQMSFYEAPSADSELVQLLQTPPTAVQQAMLQMLRAGRWSGYISPV